MVNKVGRSYKPPPNEIRGRYPGLSAIVESDGTILRSMDGKEGVGIAEVHLDARRKTGADQVCTGIGIAELTIGGPSGAASVLDEYERARSTGTRYSPRWRCISAGSIGGASSGA